MSGLNTPQKEAGSLCNFAHNDTICFAELDCAGNFGYCLIANGQKIDKGLETWKLIRLNVDAKAINWTWKCTDGTGLGDGTIVDANADAKMNHRTWNLDYCRCNCDRQDLDNGLFVDAL